ncbi:hypothetical protein T4A_4446, partial [Trichinella pseudospiralis]
LPANFEPDFSSAFLWLQIRYDYFQWECFCNRSGIEFKNDNQVRFPVEFLPQFTNDSAEQEQLLRDCPSQRFNKPDSYHNLFIVSWITRVIYKYLARGFKVKLRKATEVNTE